MAEAAGVAVLHEAGGFETVDNARDGRELFFLAAIEKHAKVDQPLDTPRQSAHASRCVCVEMHTGMKSPSFSTPVATAPVSVLSEVPMLDICGLGKMVTWPAEQQYDVVFIAESRDIMLESATCMLLSAD